jgi:benzoylformate decarboxylase
MATRYKGKQVFMETLLAEGVRYIFGNPGTTELPLVDSLIDYPQLRYILALHESVAVIMGDAYAQATGSVAVVNLHVGPGLGNGLGALYNAWEGHTPLLVTAGQQDNRLRLREPLLGHDLVAMAAPLTKWSVEVNSADEMAAVLNRACKIAREEPSGPVFVSLPMNVMEQDTAYGPLAPARLFPRTVPDPAGVAEAAGLLLAAARPAIVCGDKVARSGALAELVRLAELLGASVYSEVLPARVNFPSGHPAARERGANDQASVRKLLGDADAVLLVGGQFFEEVWFADASPFPEDAALIQLDPSPRNLARNYPVHCGLAGDVKLGLAALAAELDARADDRYRNAAARRREAIAALKAEEVGRQQARARKAWEQMPMSTARLMAELKGALPPGVIISQEAITAAPDLQRTLEFNDADAALAARGGGIGQGLPSAIGLKLAHPQRPVLAVSGDGSALYTIQALWSAAHHQLPVVFLILNNRVYRILKLNMNRYRSEAGLGGERAYPHLDLTDPELDFVRLAAGFGVQGRSVERPQDVAPAVREAFAANRPVLLDVHVDGRI